MSDMVTDPNPDPGLRIQLPVDLSEQTMRSSLDRALQLIALDLTAVCSPVMAKRYGKGWETSAFDGLFPLHVTDPTYWAHEFKIPGSPAFSVFAESSAGIRTRMNVMKGLRNELYHFRRTLTPQMLLDHLHDLSRLAKTMQLPSYRDVEAVRQHFIEIRDGKLPPSLSVEEAMTLFGELDKLKGQLEQERLAKEKTENTLEAATESLQTAIEAAASSQTADASKQQAIVDLEEEVTRLKELAEQQADQVAKLESATSSVAPTSPPDLPGPSVQAVSEFLRLSQHASQIFRIVTAGDSAHSASRALARLQEARDRVLTLAIDVPMSDSAALGVDDPKGLLESGLSRVETSVRTGRKWTVGAATTEQFAAGQASLVLDLVEAGATAVRDAVTLLDSAAWSLRSREPQTVARVDDQKVADPGTEWSWPPGDDVWVLSLRSGRLRRPRTSEVGEFTALYGDELETELVAQWISLSPQGGRIHIDEDGDACVLGAAGHYIYLGRVPSV